MKQKLLDERMEVSEEEQKYLDGQGDIERQFVCEGKDRGNRQGTAA